jgi:class 3 adenylate cyclase/predicted ATPase
VPINPQGTRRRLRLSVVTRHVHQRAQLELDVTEWLASLNLSEYAECFAENHIDLSVLQDLTDQDLEKLGVLLGDRRKMLRVIAVLGSDPRTATQLPPVDPHLRRDDAERRQLTLMFCDIVGSTALSARLDPEEFQEIIGAYHRRCAEVIAKSGGFVTQYLGDGILAYFGYPQAHEDDAERAVRAGLALIEAVAKLDAGATVLRVRIGIATGVVIVGELIGEGTAQQQTVVGETPNLAARLQTLAEPDTVVISASTRRLLGELFEYRALGSVSLKGFSDPVPVWQVTGASAIDSRFEALRTTTTPLIGREEEIELLMRRWQQAKSGDGSVVLISGESGIGKSRIAQTILDRLSSEPHTRLRYFCSPHHQDSALYPAITQLERAAGFRREDTGEQRLAKMEAVLARASSDLRQTVPLLAALLSIPTGDRYEPLNLSPQKQKEKTLQTFVAQVEGLAARQPVLMVVEDAHWGDPTSRELFDLIVDRVPALSVLAIVTFRPEYAPPWVGQSRVSLLCLNGLRPRQREEMILRVTGGKALPKQIVDQIIDRTDGVPLYIEELTKAVVESNVLTDAGDHYTMKEQSPTLAIPTSLNASLLARLDRLTPAREVAQIGAALGRQFSHELISALALMPQGQLEDALSLLVGNELIFRRGSPPDAEYTFKHAMVQDAAYSTLLRNRRQQLHARIVAALETQFAELAETQLVEMARHCAAAGLTDKAVGYCLKAGRQAIAQWALTEAVAHLRKGLDLLASMLDDTARREQELNLQITLGNVLVATKGYAAPEPGEAFARARQLCEQLNRSPKLGVLVGLFTFRLVRGELEQAEYHAKEIRQLGGALGDVRWKYVGATCSGVICSWLGKFTDARSYLENSISAWDPAFRALASSPEDNYVNMLLHLSRALLCLGYLDQARLRKREALTEARRLSPYTLAYALCQSWDDDWAIEGLKSAQMTLRSAEELLAISREQGFPMWFGLGAIMRGWCLSTVGREEEGIPSILNGLDVWRATGTKLGMPFILMALAEIYGIVGQPKQGLDRLAQAAKFVKTTKERWVEAELFRLCGTLLLSIHEPISAENSYRHALAMARQQSAKFWELRAALELGRLWRDQGKAGEARALLTPVYNWFTEGFDTPVLKDAKALLDSLQ